MTTHHTSLYDDKTNPAPIMVISQELLTTEQTEYGVRITKLKRQFNGDRWKLFLSAQGKTIHRN